MLHFTQNFIIIGRATPSRLQWIPKTGRTIVLALDYSDFWCNTIWPFLVDLTFDLTNKADNACPQFCPWTWYEMKRSFVAGIFPRLVVCGTLDRIRTQFLPWIACKTPKNGKFFL